MSVCPQGVGIPGPMSLPGGGWVWLILGPFWGMTRGIGMSKGCMSKGGYIRGWVYHRGRYTGGIYNPPLVLTPSGGHHNTYSWQAGGMHPTGMLSCYRPQVAKVMFLQVWVCPHGGVCLSACWDTTPRANTPPGSRHPPPRADTPQSRHPPGEQIPPRGQTPPWDKRPLLRTVRILLECILVDDKRSTNDSVRTVRLSLV